MGFELEIKAVFAYDELQSCLLPKSVCALFVLCYLAECYAKCRACFFQNCQGHREGISDTGMFVGLGSMKFCTFTVTLCTLVPHYLQEYKGSGCVLIRQLDTFQFGGGGWGGQSYHASQQTLFFLQLRPTNLYPSCKK